jgi:O-antigen ligase/polysaccharide polymerase Wzy-like membrane protein
VSFVTTPVELRRIYQLITAGCIAVGLTVVDQFLVGAGVLPAWASVNLGEDVRAVVYEGYTHMASFTLATLVFAVPFVVASLLVIPREHLFARRAWLWAALAAGLLALLLGGRRAGILNAALSPLVAALLWLWLPGRERRRTAWRYVAFTAGAAAALVVAAVVLDRFFGWTPTGQLTAFSSGFDFQGDEFAMERRAQFVALLRGWAEHPFFGHGFGTAAEVIRNADRPWEYELQYAMLLFHTGLFGAALYASGVVWVFAQLVRVIRGGGAAGVQAIPVAVGSLMFLVANATNPYLQAYGQLWTLFLPIAVLNVYPTAWRRA